LNVLRLQLRKSQRREEGVAGLWIVLRGRIELRIEATDMSMPGFGSRKFVTITVA
jgi:hypothetical protein